MNITDVGHLSSDSADTGEDKMLAGAKQGAQDRAGIAKFYTDAFLPTARSCKSASRIRLCPPPLASRMISSGWWRPAGKGLRLPGQGECVLRHLKLENYYVFGNQSGEDLAVGVRDSVEEDQNKRNKTDFVLWFTKSSLRTRS